MSKKGDLKTVLHMNVRVDQALADAVDSSSTQHERSYSQEVRYVLRQHYGLQQTPAEDVADVAG